MRTRRKRKSKTRDLKNKKRNIHSSRRKGAMARRCHRRRKQKGGLLDRKRREAQVQAAQGHAEQEREQDQERELRNVQELQEQLAAQRASYNRLRGGWESFMQNHGQPTDVHRRVYEQNLRNVQAQMERLTEEMERRRRLVALLQFLEGTHSAPGEI